jgi:hypothetical protein
MRPNTIQHRQIRRVALTAAAVAAALSFGIPSTATARQDPGPPPHPTPVAWESMPFRCPVERIGAQIVRCDNLSGAGVSAPLGLPQQP